MISPSTAGPLGVKHLPRIWLKLSLDARNKLPGQYLPLSSDIDRFVLTRIGLDVGSVVIFVRSNLPSYQEFEDWISTQPGVDLSDEALHEIDIAVEMVMNGINLADWRLIHEIELRRSVTASKQPMLFVD
ncbi:MAG: hypothetical protein EXS50_02320 [Candidatus Taylorbacteria bacterium]|nr:hypothetical protein [Candidatus Taylorbacteria bacterium]